MIALVLGCAECVWNDAISVLKQCSPDAIFAVKDMMAKWPARVDYGCTLHPDRTDGYLAERSRKGYSNGFDVYAHQHFGSKTKHKVTKDWAGSTGLFAVKLAIEQGFSGIILAGVPMQQEHGHVARKQPWTQSHMFMNGWKHRKDEIRPFVKSMSGWTRAVFGEPTRDWINLHGTAEPCETILSILNQNRHEMATSDGELEHA